MNPTISGRVVHIAAIAIAVAVACLVLVQFSKPGQGVEDWSPLFLYLACMIGTIVVVFLQLTVKATSRR